MKPFIKWAGGKTELISILDSNIPNIFKDNNKINIYIEPFLGAGAFFFHITNNYDFDRIVLNDINFKLINVYKVIKTNYKNLIFYLDDIKKEYMSCDDESKKHMYLRIRNEFNDWDSVNKIKQAANFIFLNKTCFNGLYRENKNGDFNVPFGKQYKPLIYNKKQIESISKTLNTKDDKGKNKIIILNKNYKDIYKYVVRGSFVYLDPPYRPITSNGFVNYTKTGFNDEEQKELAKFFDYITKKKAYGMLSNSDPKNLDINDNFFDELYKDYNIQRINASRVINCRGNSRGKVKELLITNYNN